MKGGSLSDPEQPTPLPQNPFSTFLSLPGSPSSFLDPTGVTRASSFYHGYCCVVLRIRFLILILSYVYGCLACMWPAYLCLKCVPGTSKGQWRTLDTPELEMQVIASHRVGAGNQSLYSGRTTRIACCNIPSIGNENALP